MFLAAAAASLRAIAEHAGSQLDQVWMTSRPNDGMCWIWLLVTVPLSVAVSVSSAGALNHRL